MSRHLLITSAILLAPSAMAQTPDHSDHSSHAPAAQAQPPADDHAGHAGHDEGASQHHDMRSALGDDAMNRNASGTSWRPTAAPHHMAMSHVGDWMLMAHGNIDFVCSSQNGPRADEKGFAVGMLMGTAQGRFDDGSPLQFRGAISPDPVMGKRGYRLLLAAGETADGVLTAGYVNGDIKIEASRFRGRESDQDRYDIETGELDSTAIRLSWNPSDSLALQASWADVTSPEQLEPDVDVVKWSASALYTQSFGDKILSLSGAFARKDSSEGVVLDAWLGGGRAATQPGLDAVLARRSDRDGRTRSHPPWPGRGSGARDLGCVPRLPALGQSRDGDRRVGHAELGQRCIVAALRWRRNRRVGVRPLQDHVEPVSPPGVSQAGTA